jgi:hypothetical protein
MAMTLSIMVRRKNLNEALVSLLNSLGEAPFTDLTFVPSHYPDVLPTTWTEMTKCGLLEDEGMNIVAYRLTKYGYIRALQESGRSEDPEFREQLGKICKVLKGCLNGRTDFGLISFHELVKESGVSEAFAQNALDADLIRHVLGRNGPGWDGDHAVRVPHDFGIPPM